MNTTYRDLVYPIQLLERWKTDHFCSRWKSCLRHHFEANTPLRGKKYILQFPGHDYDDRSKRSNMKYPEIVWFHFRRFFLFKFGHMTHAILGTVKTHLPTQIKNISFKKFLGISYIPVQNSLIFRLTLFVKTSSLSVVIIH